MTIKELAHTAQSVIESASASSFKRSHVYELLAAALDFSSLAALYADHVLGDGARYSPDDIGQHLARVDARARDLGYEPSVARHAATIVSGLIEKRGICARDLDLLVAQYRWHLGLGDEPPSSHLEAAPVDYEGEPDEFDEVETQVGEDGSPSILKESLDRAAASGDHRAHYVLALLLRQREDEFSVEGSAHWYEVQQDGVELDGVEKEWADAFAATRKNAGLAEVHLEAAAALGSTHAMLDLADQRDDRSLFFAAAQSADADPRRMATLAGRFDQENYPYWLNAAAESGDTDAIRALIESVDHNDLEKCWTWVHFGRLLGTDLTKSNMRAYHDGGLRDGKEYDDDVGGPLYASGDEGVDLVPLDATADLRAKEAARDLLARLG